MLTGYTEEELRLLILEKVLKFGTHSALIKSLEIHSSDYHDFMTGVRRGPPKKLLDYLNLEKRVIFCEKEPEKYAQTSDGSTSSEHIPPETT